MTIGTILAASAKVNIRDMIVRIFISSPVVVVERRLIKEQQAINSLHTDDKSAPPTDAGHFGKVDASINNAKRNASCAPRLYPI
jgi:hypothetical protein